MSKSTQDIDLEDMLTAEQSEMCSSDDIYGKQNLSASSSAEYINVVPIDVLEGLFPSVTESELHTADSVVDSYTRRTTSTNENQVQVDNAAHGLFIATVSQPSACNLAATEVNSSSLPSQNSSPKKLVAVPSEATLMVDGHKCVLRVDSTGHLTACPIAADTAAHPVTVSSTRLHRRPKTSVLLEARTKQILKRVAVEESEMSDCSLDISCSTVTQSASSPSLPDQEGSVPLDGLTTVLQREEAEGNEALSDCSTVSAENSTASVPSSSDMEQENISRQHPCVLVMDSSRNRGETTNEMTTVLKDFDTDCGTSCSSANIAVSQPAVSSMDSSNKDQIVISASNRVQNYLASLGLPVKRGRGRPRRKPLPPEELSSVMVLDGSNAVPLLDSELKSSLPLLLSNVTEPSPGETQTSIVIEQEDGTEKHIILATSQTNVGNTASADDKSCGTCQAQGMDEQAEQNNVVHLLMVPKREPVKIAVRASDVDLDKLRCKMCEFQGLHAHELQQHLTDDHADELAQLIRCRCCSFMFFSDDDLKEHFKSNHPRNMCSDCGFTSEHMYVMRRHMQRHSLTGCECHICGRRYKDQYILKMHIRMRHMEPDVLFQCNLCSKMFTRKAHLKRHLRIHNPDKPYKCPHCDYRGCERSDITKHVLVHDQPQHTCDICGKSFRHIKNKELHLKRHRGQRDYKCVFCEFYGYTYTDIRKHQERKHAGHRSVMCARCCMTFKSEHLLEVHQQTECQPVDAASDSDMNDVADSSDVLQYVTDSSQLGADDSQLIAGTTSSSSYKVFVSGNPDGLNLLEAQIVGGETMSNAEIIGCDSNIGLVSPAVEVPLGLLEH